MTLANKPASEMTLLEHYAGLALQGIVADGQPGAWELIAAQAVKGAAALVAELEAENARLKAGGCARDQGTTQFCAEAQATRELLRAAWDAGVDRSDFLGNPHAPCWLAGVPPCFDDWIAQQRQVPKP